MNLVIKLKANTTLAQAEEMFEALLKIEGFIDLTEYIRIQPGEIS